VIAIGVRFDEKSFPIGVKDKLFTGLAGVNLVIEWDIFGVGSCGEVRDWDQKTSLVNNALLAKLIEDGFLSFAMLVEQVLFPVLVRQDLGLIGLEQRLVNQLLVSLLVHIVLLSELVF